jgi:DNA-directed RNA polymerase I, II, and III subunit RPABC1
MEDKSLEILKQMLNKRGKDVKEIEKLGNPMDDTRMYNLGGVLILFSEKSRLSDKILDSYIEFCNTNNFKNGLIIIMMTSPSENIVDLIRQHINIKTNFLIQLFDIRNLQYDITQHRKVPLQRILSLEEVDILQKNLRIQDFKRELPWIDSQDAMAKYLGARPDDIIEIQRFSESAGLSKYYRCCVSNVLDT